MYDNVHKKNTFTITVTVWAFKECTDGHLKNVL